MNARSLLQSGYFNSTLQKWQSGNTDIASHNLMYPVFIIENDNDVETIKSMPGISRMGINPLRDHLEPLVKKGLTSVLLFGVVSRLPKDDVGIHADSNENPVIRALPKLRNWFPTLTVACDVCLCPYTSHGHCGILFSDGVINNSASIERIAQIALAYARAGAHIVAPSDMMDSRVGAIKNILIENNFGNKVAVLSYAVKFSSSFYGPFRDAANSKPTFGDRRAYQLPPGSAGLAHRAAQRDVSEGADMIMVKPTLPYLDLVSSVKRAHPNHPLFVYQVSGEYAMLHFAAKEGVFDLKTALFEILLSMRRAGADVIITYYTPLILNWIELRSKY